MIKVAGKRASLQDLTRQILAVPGVEDAVVFLPDADARLQPLRWWRPASRRPADSSRAAHAPRWRVQPRDRWSPSVDVSPRNSLGKLPREELLVLLAKARLSERHHERNRRAGGSSVARRTFSAAGGPRGGVARRSAGGDPHARGPRAAIDSRARNSCSPCCRTNASSCACTSHPVDAPRCAPAFRACARPRLSSRDRSSCREFESHERSRSHQERSTPSMVRLIVRPWSTTAAPGRAPAAVPHRRVFSCSRVRPRARLRATTCGACSGEAWVAQTVAAFLAFASCTSIAFPAASAPSILEVESTARKRFASP